VADSRSNESSDPAGKSINAAAATAAERDNPAQQVSDFTAVGNAVKPL